MTNQESIECTCRVGTVVTDGRVDGDEVIIHGPCHSPGPEVWGALRDAFDHGHMASCNACDEAARNALADIEGEGK